jgi:hypothetical protein
MLDPFLAVAQKADSVPLADKGWKPLRRIDWKSMPLRLTRKSPTPTFAGIGHFA